MNITYFVDDKLGGVTSLNFNLIRNCMDGSIHQRVIHIQQLESLMARANVVYPDAENVHFSFTVDDNYYRTLKRLSKLIDRTAKGALVLNYNTEMAMLDHYLAVRSMIAK